MLYVKNYYIAISNYSNFDRLSNYGDMSYGSSSQNLNMQNFSPYGSYSSFGNFGTSELRNGGDLHIDLDQEFKGSDVQHTIAKTMPISKHVEITNPVAVPVIKNIGKILQTIATN